MTVIVGSGSSQLECDQPCCSTRSRPVHGPNDGQSFVRTEAIAEEGWQCLASGKDYCPDHAFEKSVVCRDPFEQHQELVAAIRKDIKAIGCIYRTVGEALFDEATTRLAERIASTVSRRRNV